MSSSLSHASDAGLENTAAKRICYHVSNARRFRHSLLKARLRKANMGTVAEQLRSEHVG
jgi:hypothetical protein